MFRYGVYLTKCVEHN